MPRSVSEFASNLLFALGIVTSAFICGCDNSEKISVYSVPKHETLQTPEFLAAEKQRAADEKLRNPDPVPQRMLGVIIPKEPQVWFLKLVGHPDAVAAREAELRNFLQTLSFANKTAQTTDSLIWKLPAGWRELPATQSRYATLILDGHPALEMSVTNLPFRPELELSEQILSNVNRWRGQLSLPPIDKQAMESQVEKLSLAGISAFWVNFEGMARPQLQLSTAHTPPAQHAPATQALPKYETPAGWVEAPPMPFALISLQVVEGREKLKITVSRVRGDRDTNVNRWRGQLGLSGLSHEQISEMARQAEVGNEFGEFYEMTNDGRTFFGVVVNDGHDRDGSWYIKLDGNSQLAERERPRFMTFLKSLQLSERK